jgi:hypothetical protein
LSNLATGKVSPFPPRVSDDIFERRALHAFDKARNMDVVSFAVPQWTGGGVVDLSFPLADSNV